MHNPRDHGASGNGRVPDTDALQSAIDAAEGGGTVYVPAGRYLSGPLQVRSNVTLYLEAGAVLLASRDPLDYSETNAFLWAKDAEMIAILGRGTIDGQTTNDLGRRPGREYEKRPSFRTRLALLEGCKNLRVRDVTMRNSDSLTLFLRRCNDVVVDGVTILNNYFRTNTDGIVPDSCRNVRIANCNIVAGDDCICLKTHDDHPCENVVVTNCTTESIATAIKLGTESKGDFRDILVTNCTVHNSTVGIGIYIKDGGTAERIILSNLSIGTLENPSSVNAPRLREATYPIFFDVERRTPASPLGRIRDVLIRDVHILSDNGALIQGTPQSPIEAIAMDNIFFRVPRSFDFSQRRKHAGGQANPKDDRITLYARKPSYVTLAHVARFSVENLHLTIEEQAFRDFGRSALSIHDSRDGLLREITRWPEAAPECKAEPAVRTQNCLEVRYTGGRARDRSMP